MIPIRLVRPLRRESLAGLEQFRVLKMFKILGPYRMLSLGF